MLNNYSKRKILLLRNSISIFLTFILIFNLGITYSSYKIMYTESEKKVLSDGISYEKHNMVTSKGWMQYFIIKADLKNPNVKLRVLYNINGVSRRQNLADMVSENEKKNNSNTIAAINSDFFNMETITNTCGAIVIDKKVISTPANKISSQPPFATLYIDQNNNFNVKYLQNNVKIFSPNGKSQVLYGINKKYKGFNDIVMLTKEWGRKSPGAAVEMVVKSGIVQDLKYNGSTGNFATLKEGDPNYGVAIGDDETVFASAYNKNNFLLSNFKIGDKVNVGYDFGSNINAENLKMAVGGKNILLKDGNVTSEAIADSISDPLTAFGFDNNHNIIMFAVDGRQAVSAGMNMEEIAEILKQNGAVNAISFDGGGSTTAMVKPLGQDSIKTVNSPSDGEMRQIAEGLALEATGKGELDNISLDIQSPYVFINSVRKINVTACDKYNNKLKVDLSKIQWTIKGVKGSVIKSSNGAEFLPCSEGQSVITATLGKIKSSININVLSSPVVINLDKNLLDYLNINNYNFVVTGTDKDGITVPIENKNIKWSISDNLIGTVKNGVFKAATNAKSSATSSAVNKNNKIVAIKAVFGGKSASCILGKQYDPKTIDNFLKASEKFTDYQIGTFKNLNPNTDFTFTLVNDWSKINTNDLAKLKGISQNILPASLPGKDIITKLGVNMLMNPNTMTINCKEAEFIKLNADNQGITSYNPYQWASFVNSLKVNMKNNVFVCISNPISAIDSQDGQFLLDKLLKYKLQSGKNIYIVQYNSQKSSFEVKDGIRYINVKNDGLKNIPIIYVTKQGVRYNIK